MSKRKDPLVELAEELALHAMAAGVFRDLSAEELVAYCFEAAEGLISGPPVGGEEIDFDTDEDDEDEDED